MRRTAVQRLALPVTLGLTVVLALLPWSWLTWLQDAAYLVNLPLVPVRDGAGYVARLVSPPDDRPRLSDRGSIDELVEDVEYYRLRWEESQMQIHELQLQLAHIQRLDIETFATRTRPVNARITGRRPTDPTSEIELNRGSRHGVHVGAVAVWGTSHLIGRITEAHALRSVMKPITRSDGDTLLAVVVPENGREDRPDPPLVHLTPHDEGHFTGEAAKGDVRDGDRVLLADPAWPQHASALRVGRVQDVATKDQQPLRDVFIVVPDYQTHDLAQVILLVELVPEDDGEVLATGGGP